MYRACQLRRVVAQTSSRRVTAVARAPATLSCRRSFATGLKSQRPDDTDGIDPKILADEREAQRATENLPRAGTTTVSPNDKSFRDYDLGYGTPNASAATGYTQNKSGSQSWGTEASKTAERIVDRAAQVGVNATQKAANAASWAADKAGVDPSKVAKNASDTAKQAGAKVSEMASNAAQKMGVDPENAAETARKVGNRVADKASDVANAAAQAAHEPSSVIGRVAETAKQAGAKVSEMASNVAEKMGIDTEKAADTAKQAGAKVSEMASNAAEKMGIETEKAADTAKQAGAKVSEMASNASKKMQDANKADYAKMSDREVAQSTADDLKRQQDAVKRKLESAQKAGVPEPSDVKAMANRNPNLMRAVAVGALIAGGVFLYNRAGTFNKTDSNRIIQSDTAYNKPVSH